MQDSLLETRECKIVDRGMQDSLLETGEYSNQPQDLLHPLENGIYQYLISPLTGWLPCSGIERDLLALSTRVGDHKASATHQTHPSHVSIL